MLVVLINPRPVGSVYRVLFRQQRSERNDRFWHLLFQILADHLAVELCQSLDNGNVRRYEPVGWPVISIDIETQVRICMRQFMCQYNHCQRLDWYIVKRCEHADCQPVDSDLGLRNEVCPQHVFTDPSKCLPQVVALRQCEPSFSGLPDPPDIPWPRGPTIRPAGSVTCGLTVSMKRVPATIERRSDWFSTMGSRPPTRPRMSRSGMGSPSWMRTGTWRRLN